MAVCELRDLALATCNGCLFLVLPPTFPRGKTARMFYLHDLAEGMRSDLGHLVEVRQTFAQDFISFVDSCFLPEHSYWKIKVMFLSVFIFSWFFLLGYTLSLGFQNNV